MEDYDHLRPEETRDIKEEGQPRLDISVYSAILPIASGKNLWINLFPKSIWAKMNATDLARI